MGDTIDLTFAASFIAARARAMSALFDVNSPNCFDARGVGRMVSKLVTCTAAGTPVSVNLFQITGLVRVLNIVGIFEDVTEVTNFDDVYLDLWDGTASVLLSLDTDPDCSGVAVGSAVVKVATADTALALLDAAAGVMNEATKQMVLSAMLLNQKAATDTFIRMNYDNDNTPAPNCQVRWYVEWRTFCGTAGSIEAV